jgi:hypothetical protein
LYIPKLSVEINSLDKGVLKGVIKHKTDDEYPAEIKYTGEVTLTIKDKNFREKSKNTITAKNGIIEESGFNLSKDDQLIASIAFGGIVVESPEFMGVSDNVFGIYQGTYNMTLNEENIVFMYTDRINKDMSPEMQKRYIESEQDRARLFISNVNWIKGGAQGGPVVKFELGKNGINTDAYESNGLKYYVYNLSNYTFLPKFLTPLKDKSNAGTVLQGLPNGFCVHAKQETEDIIINATFQGNSLVGNWKATYKGKVLWTATFTARKILDM